MKDTRSTNKYDLWVKIYSMPQIAVQYIINAVVCFAQEGNQIKFCFCSPFCIELQSCFTSESTEEEELI